MEPYTEELFWRMLTSVKKIGELENPQDEPVRIVRHGKTKGKILGGNLSLLVSLLGTKYQPVLNESVLVLEDVDEEPHRIDRMLAQLLNAGCLGRLNGLIFGKFTDCVPSSTSDPFLTVEQVQEDYAVKMKCPVVSNFGYGHIPRKLTIPLGLEVLVDTKKEKIEIAGAGVS
jgi:muramoyltetrapeptide carboxypeptidase